MICPKCGTENKPKFKFCVKCGSNLEEPNEVNIEQVDMGGYRSEEDYSSEKNSFKIGSGTFTINDSAPTKSTGMFTADELNDTDEEFDFSSYDEPYIPKLDANRLSVPSNTNDVLQRQPMNQNGMSSPFNPMFGGYQQPAAPVGGVPQQMMNQAQPQPQAQQPPMNGMMNPQGQQQAPTNNVAPYPMNGLQQQPMNGTVPQPMGVNPYANAMYGGQPMYGAPQMMPPQIVGYDQNGMPIYSQPQPMMYAPPQIIGYDPNGMPIYSQPMPMYGAPQPMMNENGEPVAPASPYQQPMQTAMPQQQQGMPYPNAMQPNPMTPPMGGFQGMPNPQQQQPMNNMYGAAAQTPPPAANANNSQVKVSNDFWNNFFSGNEKDGKAAESEESPDDFFTKPRHDHSGDMGNLSAGGIDVSKLKKHERKKNTYMTATPDVDANELQPNAPDELNKRYMRATAPVNADELQEKKVEKPKDIMTDTTNAVSNDLMTTERPKADITMIQTDTVNADELQTYEPERSEPIMDQADKAVEALPKKKKTIDDEINSIELPEYMQARKTVKAAEPEIPKLPEI